MMSLDIDCPAHHLRHRGLASVSQWNRQQAAVASPDVDDVSVDLCSLYAFYLALDSSVEQTVCVLLGLRFHCSTDSCLLIPAPEHFAHRRQVCDLNFVLKKNHKFDFICSQRQVWFPH